MEKQDYNLIIEYRKKSHRCLYCKFLKEQKSWVSIDEGCSPFSLVRYKCIAKNMYMHPTFFAGRFCKLFVVEEDDIEV